jgi:hypothetical protein
MARSVLDWHRLTTRCAVGALVVVLLASEMIRQPAFPWKLVVSATSPRSPVEESEKDADEVLVATPRPRARCRPLARTTPAPSLLVRWPLRLTHAPASVLLVDFTDRVPIPGRGLPLRC